jgi:hypothetical protein
MKIIELKEDTMCAHDEHELKYYPRPWFKAKPELKKGTRLEVKEQWENFFGSYYRCENKDGLYDIPVKKAVEVKEQAFEDVRFKRDYEITVKADQNDNVYWKAFRKGEQLLLLKPEDRKVAADMLREILERIENN